ncbi:hypothetical protein HJC23_005614 [Cyclotella cryptica]|uniref:Peptidase A1 domain-containing protein n=1 Tax=Cyclotella cryptica TaxID=29204 RepID=A0ABD3PZ60_9STRA
MMRNPPKRISLAVALLINCRLATLGSCLSTDHRFEKFRLLSDGRATRKTSGVLFASKLNRAVGARGKEKARIEEVEANVSEQICPDFIPTFSDALCTRRSSLMAALVVTSSILVNEASANDNVNAGSWNEGNSKFGAIIDTGSPFLLVPQTSCRPEYRWGCYRPEESNKALGLTPTRERFDGNEGWVEWREGSFSFVLDESFPSTATPSNTVSNAAPASTLGLLFPKSSSMTFGVISETLMDGPGGIFLGLVKDTDSWIRPSFLGQSDVTSFSIDLRQKEGVPKSLTLYGRANPSTGRTKTMSESYSRALRDRVGTFRKDFIPLMRDLNKKYGDPTIHYVAIASSINVNGSTLASTSRQDGKLYIIFDTGCSGMCICPDLFDEQYSSARAQKAKSVWNEVEVKFKTSSGEDVTLSAKRPIATPLTSERPWGRKLDGHLVVLGLAFFDGLCMTIDANEGKIWFEK